MIYDYCLILLLAIFLIIYNASFIIHFYQIVNNLEHVNTLFVLSVPVFFISLFIILFSLITIKYIEKPLIISLFIFSSIVSYYGYFYGVIFDTEMFSNIFETNTGEALSYFNLSIILWVVLTGILPSIFICFLNIIHFKFCKELLYKAIIISCSFLIMISIFFFFSKSYISIKKNNRTLHQLIVPTYYLHGLIKYLDDVFFNDTKNYKILGLDAKLKTDELSKKNLLVIVVGETARGQNHEYNGYGRATTPYTSQKDIIAFQKVSSCGTATATSVPCMFSRLSRKEFKRYKAKNEDNLMDIINRTNTNVLWLDNDGGCKGVCNNVKHFYMPAHNKDQFCNGLSCHDEILVEYLQNNLNKLDAKDSVVVIHLIGSHGPAYYERYPSRFNKFTPECHRSDIQNCTNEQLVNTYDNTILYTDYVISTFIDKLKKYDNKWNTSLIYLSDHGESLGENNLYLHGAPYFIAPEEQTKIPMIMWFSDSFITANKLNKNTIKT